MLTTGTFALRSPVRPNPIASSIVQLLVTDDTTLRGRGLDCVDGTPLLDLKPERGTVADWRDSRQLRIAAATSTGVV